MRASRPTLLAALLLALALAARPAAAASQATRICIDVGPYLTQGVRVLVGGVDNSDWDGDSRPDKMLHNAIVMPGQPLCRRLEVNWWNAPAFDLTLVYPATGPEQTRDTARMRLCSPTTLSMGWCKTEHTRESEVLDYAKVKWSYYSF